MNDTRHMRMEGGYQMDYEALTKWREKKKELSSYEHTCVDNPSLLCDASEYAAAQEREYRMTHPTGHQGGINTKTLVVGQKVEICSGVYTRGYGKVVKVTPSGGEVQLEGEGILRFDSKGMTELQDTMECGSWFIYVTDK